MTIRPATPTQGLKIALAASLMAAATFATPHASAAGYSVQTINSPGPAIRMSGNGAVTGFFVAKCSTINGYERFTYCFNAPWLFDGKGVTKLTNKFGSNANAQAVAVNDSLELVGADASGAFFYSAGVVTHTSGRLFAVNNNHVALGMATINGVYQPITYQLNSGAVAIGLPGTNAVDINDANMVAGWFTNASNVQQAFIADSTGVTLIPNLADANNAPVHCRPARISQVNAGSGQVWVAGNCANNRPFLFERNSGLLTELGFPGSSNLSVVSVNSQGVAAGTAVKPAGFAPDGYTALVWPAGATIDTAPIDLNANQAFAPATTAWNVHATDINDAGTVLVGYNDISGNFYTFLLRPVP